jgi:hypothetical protein
MPGVGNFHAALEAADAAAAGLEWPTVARMRRGHDDGQVGVVHDDGAGARRGAIRVTQLVVVHVRPAAVRVHHPVQRHDRRQRRDKEKPKKPVADRESKETRAKKRDERHALTEALKASGKGDREAYAIAYAIIEKGQFDKSKLPSDIKEKYFFANQHEVHFAKVGERGAIVASDKAPKSSTPNKDPQGKGTAKGDASGKRGADVTAEQEVTLQNKADEFNEKDSNTRNGRATLGALKSVFQRGLGAFTGSHSPEVKSASQWAFARVNAYLYLLKNGRPENEKYTTDFDLLPEKHPKATK